MGEYKENWDALAQGYEVLRREAETGRTETVDGLSKEASTFYDYVVEIAFADREAPLEHREDLKRLMARVVEVLQKTIGIIDFWRKPIEVKKLRANIDTEILLTEIPQLADRHERVALEIVKLAGKRHRELTR